MKIIRTHEMDPGSLTDFEREMVYNGLDCCVTRDCYDVMHTQLDSYTAATYEFSKELQGPTIEMRCRGVLVDHARRLEVIDMYYDTMLRLERQLDQIVLDGVGMDTFNWRSTTDLRRLFYDILCIPPIRRQGRVTVDRDAREKLEIYPAAQQIVKHLNVLTELGDKISVLKTATDPDGYIRTSYNIAGTSTGRFSSSLSEFGTGGNLQNVEEALRSIFIADKGYKFAKCDAKSGESFCVGAILWNLFGDSTYLDACESGDPHTAVARIMWPNLPWTGDFKKDKDIAETPYYRHYTYRFMCKKLGHGSNYGGQPPTLSQQAKVELSLVEQFQPKYFAAFPGLRKWHAHVEKELYDHGYLVSLMGRKRYFFKRRNDPKTLREAIAYDPQSSLAEMVNTSLIRLWKMGIAVIVMHDHDALTFMYPEKDEDAVVAAILDNIVTPVELANGRILRIPYDCEVGWNKGKYCCGQKRPECKGCKGNENLNGLKPYSGTDKRTRVPEVDVMDRRLRGS